MTSKSSTYALAIRQADKLGLTATVIALEAAQAATDPQVELGHLTQAVVSLTTESYMNRTPPDRGGAAVHAAQVP
jgi:hypothetical protein